MTIRDIAIVFGFQVDENSEKKAENSIKSLKNIATKLLGATAIGFSLVSLKDIYDEYKSINGQLGAATHEMDAQSDIQQQILKAANESQISYSNMADSVSKLAQNNDVFSGVQDAANFSGVVAKNFASASKSESEISSIMSVMNSSMSQSTVDVETIMQLFSQSPQTLKMFADSLGVSTAEIEKMASTGQITSDTIKYVFEKNTDTAKNMQTSLGDTWIGIKESLGGIWNWISETAGIVWNDMKFFWQEHSETITGIFESSWNSIKDSLGSIWSAIKETAETIWLDLESFWTKHIESVKTTLADTWLFISNSLRDIWEGIKTNAIDAWNFLTIEISLKITQIKDSIIWGFNQAVEWIKLLPSQAIQWGSDIIQGIIDGIKSKIGGVVSAVKEVGNTVKDFLGFSVPDKGPLTDFPNWMPDFMGGLAKGIRDNIPLVKNALEDVGASMNIIANAKYASQGVAGAITNNALSRSITQNVIISNEFNSEASAQRNISKSMDKAAGDATGELARALAYAR